MELSKFAAVIFVIAGVAVVLLFTPYETYLEGALALIIVVAAVVGSLMHPRREVFYVQTAMSSIDADRNQTLERDYLAVRVELVRLWLWFVPTSLAVVMLLFFAVGGTTNFSFLNWIFSSRYTQVAIMLCQYPPLLVLVLLSAWIAERRVMRDAEACTAASFNIYSVARGRWVGRIAYSFRGDQGEYFGGDCLYFGFTHPRELASIVFHNVRKPDLNKIATGFIFHRFTVLGRGVTDLDEQTTAAQTALARTLPVS
jgi:hypothetical protein